MNKAHDTLNTETIESLQLVREWMHTVHSGTLATLSRKPIIYGFPLGSIVPFTVDNQGRPVILIAEIAAHTRNIKEDNRATLFISDPNTQGDPQSGWRASIVGRFTRLTTAATQEVYEEHISQEEMNILKAKYIHRTPASIGYFTTHNFHFWRMSKIEIIRYIAGFGRIKWLNGDEFSSTVKNMGFTKMEQGALEHMNADHDHNLLEIVKAFTNIEAQSAQMTSLNIDGFSIETQEPNHHFAIEFDELIQDANQYKAFIIRILAHARQILKEQTIIDQS